MAGHLLVRCVVKLSIRPLGKCSPHLLDLPSSVSKFCLHGVSPEETIGYSRFTCMRVSITLILQLGPSLKILQDQGVWSSSHGVRLNPRYAVTSWRGGLLPEQFLAVKKHFSPNENSQGTWEGSGASVTWRAVILTNEQLHVNPHRDPHGVLNPAERIRVRLAFTAFH